LKEENYAINIAKKKQLLNAFKAKNRLLYAKEAIKELENINFSKIVFSDESSIQRGHGSRSEYIRKRQKKRTSKELANSNLTGTLKIFCLNQKILDYV